MLVRFKRNRFFHPRIDTISGPNYNQDKVEGFTKPFVSRKDAISAKERSRDMGLGFAFCCASIERG